MGNVAQKFLGSSGKERASRHQAVCHFASGGAVAENAFVCGTCGSTHRRARTGVVPDEHEFSLGLSALTARDTETATGRPSITANLAHGRFQCPSGFPEVLEIFEGCAKLSPEVSIAFIITRCW